MKVQGLKMHKIDAPTTLKVVDAVHKDAEEKGITEGSSEMVCPLCGGTLKYEVTPVPGRKGRMRADCSTEGCTRWMEGFGQGRK